MSDIISEFEDGLVLLSKAVRKVRTQEGATFYGLPIGAPITADIINKKNAEKAQQGVKPPTGAIDNEIDAPPAPPTPPTPGTAVGGMAPPTTPNALGAAQAGGEAPKPPKIKKSELKGNKHFKVGKSKYTAPAGSKLIRPVDKPEVAYVLTPDGKVHAFVEKGEAEVSPTLSKSLAQRFQGDLTNDAKFQEEEFEATSSPYSMSNLGTGSVLTDVDGNPQFVKQADGTWLNEELDVALDEKDVSPFFESGELVPQASASDAATQEAFPNPEVTSFADMDKNEFMEAVDGFPTGYQVSIAANSPEGEETVFTKAASGKWTHSADGSAMESGNLYYLKSKLGIKSQESFEAPEATPELNELDELLSADRIKARQPAVGKDVTSEWLDSAPVGAQFAFSSSFGGGETLWNKTSDTDWEVSTGYGMITTETLKTVMGSNKGKLKISKLGPDPEPEPEEEKAPEPVSGPVKKPKKEKPTLHPNAPQEKAPEKPQVEPLADWEKELLESGDNAVNEAEAAKQAEEDAKPKNEGISEGTKIKDKSQIAKLVPGSMVTYDEGITFFTKQEDGNWQHDSSGLVISEKEMAVRPAGYGAQFTDPRYEGVSDVPETKPVSVPGEFKLRKDDFLTSAKDFFDAPVGTKFMFPGMLIQTKQANGMFPGGSGDKSTWLANLGDMDVSKVKIRKDAPSITEADEAKAAKQVPAPGEKFTNLDQLDSMAVGDKAVWTSSYGASDSYVKVSADTWETSEGSPLSKSTFTASIQKGYLSYQPKAGELKDGDALTSAEDLEKLAIGDIAVYKADSTNMEYVKTSPELFMAGNYAATLSSLAEDGADGLLTFKKGNSDAPEATAPQAEEPQAAPSNDLSDELDVQFYAGGPAVSQKTVQEGIDLLEGFSGFQIKYAFKNNKDHPLVQPEMLAELKDASSKAHSDLKPKQALIAYLKDKIGVKTEAPKATWNNNPNIPKINLGARTPESGVQGFDGGQFTPKDLQDAIDILENFSGKLMKAELNKKGNALGSLDPNKLVGFDKDKLVTKQKLIDLLKLKLDKHKKSQDENEELNALNELDEELDGTAAELNDSALATPGGEEPESAAPVQKRKFEAYKQFKDGTKLTITGGDEVSFDTKVYTYDKKEEMWFDSDGFVVAPISVSTWANHPNTTYELDAQSMLPDYAKTPPAVLSKTFVPLASADLQQADTYPVGIVLVDMHKHKMTKTGENAWLYESAGGTVVSTDTNAEVKALPKGSWRVLTLPEVAPAPVKKTWTAQEAFEAPEGTVFDQFGIKLVKVGPDKWNMLSASGALIATYPNSDVSAAGETGSWEFVSAPDVPAEAPAAPSAPEYNKSGLTPGKYSTTSSSKAYMVVHADGKGTYVNGKGVASKMSANAVKKNHDAGMNVYGGLVENVPEPAKAEPAAPTAAKKTATAKVEVVLADGTYYLGSSNSSKATVYEVSDGMFTAYKNGETTDLQPISKLKTNYLKGKIVDKDGNSVLPAGHEGEATFWNKPTSLVTLGKVQKLLEDEPELKLFSYVGYGKMKQTGHAFEMTELGQKVTAATGLETGQWYSSYIDNPEWNEAAHSLLKSQLAEFLKDVNTDPPEVNTSALFDWEFEGVATMPADTVENIYVYDSAPIVNAYIKKVSAAFGDGKIFYTTGMGKYDKASWIQYYKAGDFKSMYQLEVQIAANKGKSHPTGYLHPGYEGNAATNKISWGAAVPGEFPAGKVPEGTWSSTSQVSKWAKEEIDNYLIAANMKHPEHLSSSERRLWVNYHLNGSGYKTQVDALSVKAKQSADAGNPPQTDTPVWTDDIVPQKSYTYLFDEGPFITKAQWSGAGYQESNDWWTDNIDSNADFKTFVDNFDYDSIGYDKEYYTGSTYGKQNIIGDYSQDKYDEYQAELLKPVWKKKKLLEDGSHQVWLMENQFGKLGIFKPVEGGEKNNFRAEVEHASSLISRAWGFNTPNSELYTSEEGEYGQLQEFKASIGDFRGPDGSGVDFATLTDKQLGQLSAEHVLDWILDNDDTHSANVLIGEDGNLVGIDKGRGFYVYGNWDGFSGTTSADTNAALVYTRLYNAIRSGKLTKEQADAAYLGALKAAKRIQKSDPTFTIAQIMEGTKNRKKWSPPGYMTHFDHSQAPQNAEQLVQAFLDRKAGLVDDVEKLWSGIYEKAGMTLPEPPTKVLGEDHLSGWEEPDLDAKVTATQHWGAAPLHQSPSIVDGHSLIWEEELASGKVQKKGKFALGILAQEKMLSFLSSKVKGGSNQPDYESPNVPQFPNMGPLKSSISAAAKNLTKNIVDKNLDEETWNKFKLTKEKLRADLAQWDPEMPAKDGFHHFDASDFDVPEGYLYQYKMALEHYQQLAFKVNNALNAGEPTNKGDFTLFTPVAVKKKPKVYSHTDGKKYTELTNGQYLASDGTMGKMESLPSEVALQQNGWTSNEAPTTPSADPVNYSQVNATGAAGTVDPDTGVKKVSDTVSSNGHQGKEYVMTLPTGEVVRFRNHSHTSTSRTQSGMVTFELAGDDTAVSLERVQAHLENMGLDLAGADETTAETIYWRQQFQGMFVRNQNDLDDKQKKAIKKLSDKFSKLNKSNHPKWFMTEVIGSSMTPAEEAEFWKELANEAFGADKVSAWVSAEKHLPRYSHMNLHNVEENTGAPIYDRIDVDKKKLFAEGTFIAIGNNGKDNSLLNYITTGGMLSTEERLRTIGFKTGASSQADQGTGGAASVFTRVAKGATFLEGAMFGDHVAYWSPEVMAHTSTYSFTGDNYGNWDSYENAPNNPLKALKHNSQGNETMVKHSLSLYDYMEVMVFSDAAKRNQAIQRMKALGIETLRGLPIEDRLVMRNQLKAALDKAKAQWQS
jgi:hypothetical protein